MSVAGERSLNRSVRSGSVSPDLAAAAGRPGMKQATLARSGEQLDLFSCSICATTLLRSACPFVLAVAYAVDADAAVENVPYAPHASVCPRPPYLENSTSPIASWLARFASARARWNGLARLCR